jgi:hypothetical protein
MDDTLQKLQMDSPLSKFNREEIMSYAIQLLNQAVIRLDLNEPDSPEAAAWRIADALGALSNICPENTMGIHEETGLGYRLHDNTITVPAT